MKTVTKKKSVKQKVKDALGLGKQTNAPAVDVELKQFDFEFQLMKGEGNANDTAEGEFLIRVSAANKTDGLDLAMPEALKDVETGYWVKYTGKFSIAKKEENQL